MFLDSSRTLLDSSKILLDSSRIPIDSSRILFDSSSILCDSRILSDYRIIILWKESDKSWVLNTEPSKTLELSDIFSNLRESSRILLDTSRILSDASRILLYAS